MKRQFEGFALQSSRPITDPSKSYEEPRPVQALDPNGTGTIEDFEDYDLITGDAPPRQKTNFREWKEEEIRIFLDHRGEDFDDCHDFASLVDRAEHCEANTGPAVRPSTTPTAAAPGRNQGGASADDIDPLDAFMAEIASIEDTAPTQKKSRREEGQERFEETDHVAEFLERRQQKKRSMLATSAGGAMEGANAGADTARAPGGDYNSDEEVYAAARAAGIAAGRGGPLGGGNGNIAHGSEGGDSAGRKREIQPLAALHYSEIDLEEFNKDFYQPPPELAALDATAIAQRQRGLGVKVSGYGATAPVEKFEQCGFDSLLMKAIVKAGYSAPTPIQAQALPLVLSGRDVLGVAKTGSGKTAAFVLPMLVHVMDQRELAKGEGPIAVIAAPTRELAEQIHKETRKFSRPYGLAVCAAWGGLDKGQQIKELKAGVEIAVCTPGRMIDLIKAKSCTLKRTTYVVLDEADRMFDMGFEPQVRSLLGQIRPDRQALLFSATMPRRVERLAAEALTSPVRVTVGVTGAANEDIKQVVSVLESEDSKRQWLLNNLSSFVDDGEVLIFVNQKSKAEELCTSLESLGIAKVGAIHGDLSQVDRMEILSSFREGKIHVLVATDVAARGLDIKTLKTVVNYEPAKDIDTHVHRIGRTGRAGDKEGVAYTLLVPTETRAAGHLERCLAAAGQEVPAALHELAMRDPRYKQGLGGGRAKGRGRGRGRGGREGRGGRPAVGGIGLGFGEGAQAQPLHTGAQASFAAATEARNVNHTTLHVTGFEPSHASADVHFGTTAATGAAPQAQERAGAALPPPPPPSGGWGALPLPPPIAPPPLPPPSQQQQGPAAAAMAAKHAAVGQRFQSAFVSSGTRGGDLDAKPEIVLPKKTTMAQSPSSSRVLPSPPVPVAQQPLYLQRQQFGHGSGGGGTHWYGGPPGAPPHSQTPTAAQSAEVQQAIARAREIAARLAAQASRGGGR